MRPATAGRHPAVRIAALLITFWLATALTACGQPPGPRGAASASRTASSARTINETEDCSPRSNISSLTGPVAVYYQNTRRFGAPEVAAISNGCSTVSLIDRSGHTSTVVSRAQPAWLFNCPVATGQPPTRLTGLTPGPATAVSADRAYWWDGSQLRWLDGRGVQGASDLTVPDQVAMEFSVSPNNGRIVITEIDFRKLPLHRITWIEDLGSHANKSILFDADMSATNNAPTGWPWGWHGDNPVLYDYPLCVVVGGDQFFAMNHPRVVDHATGNRLVSYPDCYGGTITDGGVFCTTSPSALDNPSTARALVWIDWTGKQISQWPLPYQTVFCYSDLNPAKTSVLASCQPNIYTQPSPLANNNNGPRHYQFGTGLQLPAAIANASVRWLDDDLILALSSRPTGSVWIQTVAIWSLIRQVQLIAPVDVLGNQIGRMGASY